MGSSGGKNENRTCTHTRRAPHPYRRTCVTPRIPAASRQAVDRRTRTLPFVESRKGVYLSRIHLMMMMMMMMMMFSIASIRRRSSGDRFVRRYMGSIASS